MQKRCTASSRTTPSSQVFQFSASDVNGAGYIAAFQGWFGSTTSGQNSCYFQYTREGDTIALLDDTGMFFTQGGPAELGSSTVLYNNQCRIVLQNSSVSRLNNTLILNLSIVFNSSFTGTKTLQVNVFDESGEQTDWQTVGSWAAYQAPPQTQPAATEIWPNSGTIGMAVTIFGSNFGASQGSSSLTINGVSAGAAPSGAIRASASLSPRTRPPGMPLLQSMGHRATAFFSRSFQRFPRCRLQVERREHRSRCPVRDLDQPVMRGEYG